MNVIRISDNKVIKVHKYILGNEGQESIWSNDWYGRHVIGQDCIWDLAYDKIDKTLDKMISKTDELINKFNESNKEILPEPKIRWNIIEDSGYFGDEWDNWEHMDEEERFEYFKQVFTYFKHLKESILK